MSVIVYGMEMPFTCLSCDFHKCAGGIGDYCTLTKKKQFRFKNRPSYCPLVYVPPHGDLIDRDALKEQLEYVASLEWNQRVGASPGIECAIDMLDDAQTVIPAEPPKEE